jgi:hypothetical protein
MTFQEIRIIATRKWKCIKVRKSTKCQGYFLSMCDVKVLLTFIFVVEIFQGTRGCWWRWFTIDVPPSSLNLVLRWLLFYLFCSSIFVSILNTMPDVTNTSIYWLIKHSYMISCKGLTALLTAVMIISIYFLRATVLQLGL